MDPEPILETRNLCFEYPNNVAALNDISMTIPSGKKIVVLGPNGSGKSTLFLHFNGVLKPKSGEVIYAGERVEYSAGYLTKLRSEVSVVLQNPDDQIFSATVEEDVAFGPLNLGLDRVDVERRIDEALHWVGLEDYREKPTHQLSFGERKRVALAGSLAMKPKVLIMDEPTAGLDFEMVHELLELSDELNHRGLTVVISTHDVETAYEWADEVRALNRGKLVFSGTPERFFEEGELLHDLGMMPPLAFTLNQQQHLRLGTAEKPYPRNIIELAHKFFSTDQRLVGKIHLICVDKLEREEPIATPPSQISHLHFYSGVYGATARRYARERRLDVHYRFHSIEYGLLLASMGHYFLLYSDSSLCHLVEAKVRELESKTGLKIELTKAS